MTAIHEKIFNETAILVADADDSTQELAINYLEDQGAVVTGVSECANVLSSLKNSVSEGALATEIAFIDIGLPGGSVPGLLKEIRADNDLKDIQIIILTADASREAIYDCFLYGISGFVLKPTQKSMLQEELRKAVRRISTKFV